MRRLGTIIASAVTVLTVALPAYAQEQYPPQGISGAGDRGIGDRVTGGGDLALTGADIGVWVGIGVALVLLGVAVLWARRRAVAAR